MSLALSAALTRSTSALSASRSSCSSPAASSTRWDASVTTDVIAVERAAGVANSVGSRFRNTDRTRPRSGRTSASRRRRPRVIVWAAMVPRLPRARGAGTLRCDHADAWFRLSARPLLGRALGAHAGVRQRLQRALDVLRLDHQVEVVARLGAAARPAREAAAEQ